MNRSLEHPIDLDLKVLGASGSCRVFEVEGINILPQLGGQIAIHSTEGGAEFPKSDYFGCFVPILSGN